jgi:hypothetical protein
MDVEKNGSVEILELWKATLLNLIGSYLVYYASFGG